MLKGVINTLRYTVAKGRYVSKSKMNKGEIFEREVFDYIHNNVKGYKRVLVDLLIPNGVGGTTQIDIVLVHRSGIYVIECKNYNATVSGGLLDAEWVVKYKNGKEYGVYNPVMQNEGHIKNLMYVLRGYKKSCYKSLVLFSDRSVLDGCGCNKVIKSIKTIVTTESNLPKCVKSINKSKDIISIKSVSDVYYSLNKYARSSKKAKEKHSNYVKGVQNNKK